MLPPMTLQEKGSFLLHHSLHTSFPKVTMDCMGRDGVVLDILKCLGNPDSILSLSRSDKTNSMSYVSGSNDGWMTTRELG